MSTAGVEWQALSADTTALGRRRGDGDTCWLIRRRQERLGDKLMWVEDVDPVSIRLVWVDTPERGEIGYAQATEDLSWWLDEAFALGMVRVMIYESAGWDRMLGDIIRADGQSASQWLMIERGWPVYERK